MRFALPILAIFSLCAVAQTVEKQEAPLVKTVPVVELKMGDPVRLPVLASALETPIVCSDDAIYFRKNTPQDFSKTPVIRVDRDNHQREFNFANIPNVEGDIGVPTFGVDRTGNPFAVVTSFHNKKRDWFLVRYSSNGSYRSKTSFEVAAMPSEAFLLSNGDVVLQGRMGIPDSRTAIQIFSASGEFKKDLLAIDEQKKLGDEAPPQYKMLVTRQDEILLLRPNSVLSIYSANGDLVREVKLNAGVPGTSILDMNILRGNLLVSSWRSEPPKDGEKTGKFWAEHTVFDLQTGDAVMTYRQFEPGIFACLQGENAVWLRGNKEGYFEIRTARLQ
jgi:hypothetical protein